MLTLLKLFATIAFAFLNRVRGGLLAKESKLLRPFAICLMTLFIAFVAYTNTCSLVTTFIVAAIYIVSITTIFGSINPYNRKEGAGAIKQWLLDKGYQTIGVYATNCLGLNITGILQSVVLFTFHNVSVFTPLIIGTMMPLVYSFCYGGEIVITLKNAYYSFAIVNDELRLIAGSPRRFYCLSNAKEWLWALILGASVMFL